MRSYFDYNATSPLAESAHAAWVSAQEVHWQNPSSLYREAGAVRRCLEEAREEIAGLLHCESRRIVFNAGATEGCNAVMAHAARTAPRGAYVCVSAIEHPAVREAAAKWFGPGRVIQLSTDSLGVVCADQLRDALKTGNVTLVSVMAANNETGVLQPWEQIATVCRETHTLFHCDASQWVGKKKSEEWAICDWMTVSGHKFGGPKGTGLLLVPEGADALALQAGGPQESGHRGGTENYPAIAAMLAALRDRENLDEARFASYRDHFEAALLHSVPGSRIIGGDAPRLWNTCMALMPAHNNLKWLTRLSERGYAVSTGSACSSGKGRPSPVMAAMGLNHDEMGRVLRFSSGPGTTGDDWEALASAVADTWISLETGKQRASKVNLASFS